ncbi:MAG TPA: PDZ domain-containing protein [Opitutaceae bacterium]|nr:PDZ domain-containing protein [Opitutaceae bacterium]
MTPKHIMSVGALLLAAAIPVSAESGPPLLLQEPSLSGTQIAFSYGGDIWTVDRSGGEAHRLVAPGGDHRMPIFSPDGSKVAYTGLQDGNVDVYVVDAAGGEPVRLTYHPGVDHALGWTPDGSRIVFSSNRATFRDLPQLFTVPVGGGMPEELPLPSGTQASYAPDGRRLAYVPFYQVEPDWKMYRGGQTTPIWVADLSDSSVTKVPRDNSNDRCPMWVGDAVYFLSDREGRFTLFACDMKTLRVRKVMDNGGFDIAYASAGPGAIVYSQFDSIHLYDLASGQSRAVPVRVAADMPQLRPHFEKIRPEQILGSAISPSGKRALFEAHGEIFSVPAEKGDVRNLTQSPGVADRDPAWSPDGKSIAFFSDESGEYALSVRTQDGLGAPRRIDLGRPPSFFYSPRWSPDSSKIAYSDKRLKLWYVAVAGGAPVGVDTDLYGSRPFVASWSPDSQWITYAKQLQNNLHAVFVYSLAERRSWQVTDGLSDAGDPRFDRGGRYLYFSASTTRGLSAGGDMSGLRRPQSASIYAAVLLRDVPSPVAPESDEEEAAKDEDVRKDKDGPDAARKGTPPAAEAKPGDARGAAPGNAKDVKKDEKAPAKPVDEAVRIDFDGLDQRIVALPLAEANYVDLQTGKEGVLFAVNGPIVVPDDTDAKPHLTVTRFELKTRKPEAIADGVSTFKVSFDGEKMLIEKDKKWFIKDAVKEGKSGKDPLATGKIEAYVDPGAEWRQMYREVWRIQRDYFYDPGYHGLDIAAAERLYEPYVAGIASRRDLNVLFREMTGWFVVGHMYVSGGAEPQSERVAVGLLGADYVVENGRYRIARIYHGENWNPKLQAPLTQPGVRVSQGDYLLAVNGRDLGGKDEIYRLFQETAGKQTVIRVGPKPDGSGAHDETVVPVDSESNLRYRAWIDGNRRKVEEMSGGRLAYVHLPDTFSEGFTNFNRYYFAQVGKQGAILDERFNHGGVIPDYIVDLANRQIRMLAVNREGARTILPSEVIPGPKVMLINEMSGSGGDALPWMFRASNSGTLVGTRTWGGLIGIGDYPQLIDGGRITSPEWAIYGTHGQWEVENHGVAPDIEVEMDPRLVRQGHDPQLEKAVAVALEQLAGSPPPTYPQPPYPNYHQKLPQVPPGP